MTYGRWMGPVFILPTLFLLLLVIGFPLAYNLSLSFHEKGLLEREATFIGLGNFRKLIHSTEFWHALVIDIIWTVSTVGLQVILGTCAALTLHCSFKGRGFSRSIILIPYLTPPVIVALMWQWLLNDNYGLVNYLLKSTGIIQNPPIWLGSMALALPTIIFIAVWEYFPFVTISILARLQTIPPELPEAATVDGATAWQVFRYVTLPQLRSVYFIIILLRGLWMFNKFDLVWLLTGGGPVRATETLPILSYITTFNSFKVGLGAAVNAIIFLILGITAIIYFKVYKVEEKM